MASRYPDEYDSEQEWEKESKIESCTATESNEGKPLKDLYHIN